MHIPGHARHLRAIAAIAVVALTLVGTFAVAGKTIAQEATPAATVGCATS